jgi:hypothetical protein
MTAKKPAAKKAAKKKPGAKRGRGRPSTYRQEVADIICARLSQGEPLAEICREVGMPPVRTVSQWKEDHPAFAADFARARDEGYDAIAADCLRIADETEHDTVMVGQGENERAAANTEWISRSKLRVETRLKLLAKWDPRRYGEKMTTELTGKDGKDLPAVPAGVLVVPGLMADPNAWSQATQAAAKGTT